MQRKSRQVICQTDWICSSNLCTWDLSHTFSYILSFSYYLLYLTIIYFCANICFAHLDEAKVETPHKLFADLNIISNILEYFCSLARKIQLLTGVCAPLFAINNKIDEVENMRSTNMNKKIIAINRNELGTLVYICTHQKCMFLENCFRSINHHHLVLFSWWEILLV